MNPHSDVGPQDAPSATSLPVRKPGPLARAIRFVALAMIALMIGLLWSGPPSWCGTWLDVGARPPAASCDFVMVLGGDPNTRPYVAAALVRAGLARQVLLSRVADSVGPHGTLVPEHELSRRVLLARGVPASDIILLDREATTTHDEAHALADFLKDHPAARMAVVTNHFHTRRARWVFRQVLGNGSSAGGKAPVLCFVSAPTDDFSLDRWWETEDGFMTVLGENLKLVFYVFYYDRRADLLGALALIAALGGYVALTRRRSRTASIEPDPTPGYRSSGD